MSSKLDALVWIHNMASSENETEKNFLRERAN